MLKRCLKRLKTAILICESWCAGVLTGHGTFNIFLTSPFGNLFNLEYAISWRYLSETQVQTSPSLARLSSGKGTNFASALVNRRFILVESALQLINSIDRMKGDSRIPLFVAKLFDIVQNPEIEAIAWTSNGHAFRIQNITRFTQQILPRYFNHKNYASFIRQLNIYGFRKIPHRQGENVYMNRHFKAGARGQLRHIARQVREGAEMRDVDCEGLRMEHGRELAEIRSGQKILEQMSMQMALHNQRLAQFSQDLARKIQNRVTASEQRLEELLLMLMVSEKREIAGQILEIAYEPKLDASAAAETAAGKLQQDECPKGDLIESIQMKIRGAEQGPCLGGPESPLFSPQDKVFQSIDKLMDADDSQKPIDQQQR